MWRISYGRALEWFHLEKLAKYHASNKRNYAKLGAIRRFVGKNCRGDKLRADNRDNVLLARIDGTVAVAKNKEVDKEIELSNDEGKSRMALFHGNLTPKSVARREKLLGILPQIKQKMLFECTPKKDKYEPQKDWVNFSKYVSRYCRSAKQTDLWKMSSSRKIVGWLLRLLRSGWLHKANCLRVVGCSKTPVEHLASWSQPLRSAWLH